MELSPGKTFANRYLLIDRIGTGGYSQVWLAEDTKAGNLQIALKIFAPEKGLDKRSLDQFSREYAIVFNLNHQNLLKPTYFDDFNGSPYLVLPYCKNGSLFHSIGEMDEGQIAVFMHQAASALEYLHNQDPPIIHQDIKPDNFLIDNNGNYLLSDFGISSKIRRTLTRSMGKQSSSGTTAYMAPERFSRNLDDRNPIKANDVFSLGVTLFELLTGELPYGDLGGIVAKTGTEPADLPERFAKELGQTIHLCIHPEPHNRPTASELKQCAEKYMNSGKWEVPERLKLIFTASTETRPNEPEYPKTDENAPVSNTERTKERMDKTISQPGQTIPNISDRGFQKWPYLLLAIATILVIVLLVNNAENRAGRQQESQRAEQLAQQQRDLEDWASAMATNTRESYEKYLGNHPNGSRADDARSKIREINEAKRKAEQEEAFRRADIERRRQQEEADRILAEDRQLQQEQAERRANEERRRQQEEEAQRLAEEEKARNPWFDERSQTMVVQVYNPITGRTWMDRNLGAARAATSSTDAQAYGDLYQWGRGPDGHQKRNSTTTRTLSRSNNPGHKSFIISNVAANRDWRSPQNHNLWQGVNGINLPQSPAKSNIAQYRYPRAGNDSESGGR